MNGVCPQIDCCLPNPFEYLVVDDDVQPLFGDNGFDPVLGPPYPPVNYQAFIAQQGTGSKITWTVPDVLISIGVDFEDPNYADLLVTNYLWPDWGAGTNYGVNSKTRYSGVDYYSLVSNNLNHQPDSSPAQWAVDTTVFKLYSEHHILGDAAGTFALLDTANPGEGYPAFYVFLQGDGIHTVVNTFYIEAVFGGNSVFSNLLCLDNVPM